MHTLISFQKMRNIFSLFALTLAIFVITRSALAQEMDPNVREHVKKATGQILMGAKKPGEDKIDGIGWGSGWFINSTGLMVTNSHVVNPTHYAKDPISAFQARNQIGIIQYEVTLNGGTDDEKSYKGLRMYACESADLAFLQVRDDDGGPLSTPHYLELIPSEEVEAGQRVFAVGYPHGSRMAVSKEKHAPVTISSGNISDIVVSPSGRIKQFRSDVEIVGGNSGGPLVDINGRFVGVNVEGGADAGESSGVYAGQIPADVVVDFIRAALGLNKIDTDLVPFLHLLVGKNLNVFIPGRERQEDKEIVEFKDGELTTGQITDKELVWKTSFGIFTVPVKQAGYAINDNGKAMLLLDGGERLSAGADNVELNFTNSRGRKSTLKMSNLQSVLFRKQAEDIELPDVDTIVLDGHGCKLYLTRSHLING